MCNTCETTYPWGCKSCMRGYALSAAYGNNPGLCDCDSAYSFCKTCEVTRQRCLSCLDGYLLSDFKCTKNQQTISSQTTNT